MTKLEVYLFVIKKEQKYFICRCSSIFQVDGKQTNLGDKFSHSEVRYSDTPRLDTNKKSMLVTELYLTDLKQLAH